MNERLLKSQKQASVKNKSRLIWDLSEAEKEMCDNIVVGEAEPGFNIKLSVYLSHNYFRILLRENNERASLCLVCWKSERVKVLYRIPKTNAVPKSITNHFLRQHSELAGQLAIQRQQVLDMRSQKKQEKDSSEIEVRCWGVEMETT